MSSMSTPLQKSISLKELTPEQFKIVEKAALFDELKKQYKKLKFSMEFDLSSEISDWLETVNSVHTRRMYFTAVNHFLRFCNNNVLEITPKDADKYLRFLQEDKCSGGTVKLYFKAVSSFYTYMERLDRIRKNPFKNSKIKIDSKPKNKYIPTGDEIDLVEAKALDIYSSETYVKIRIALHLMQKYGVRIGFLDNIKVMGNMLISKSKGKEYKVLLTDEEDIVYYNMDKDIIENLNSNSIAKWFNDCVRELYEEGLITDKFSPHCLRHYYAKKFYEGFDGNGDVVYSLMKKLHHTSMNTTLVYLRSIHVIE